MKTCFKYTLMVGLFILTTSSFADVGSVINKSYVSGAYGYVGELNGKFSIDTVVYPKIDYSAIAYGDGKFVAVGKGGQILYLPEGETNWRTASSFTINNLNSVQYIAGRFVVAADNGEVIISSDGIKWSNLFTLPINYRLQNIAGENEYTYVAVGGNGLIYSIKNKVPTRIITPTKTFLNSVSYAQGKYVVVGNAGTIITSVDSGIHWAIESSGTAVNLLSVKYLNDNFYTVGDGGVVMSSKDAVTWAKYLSLPANLNLSDIAYENLNSNFIVIGFDGKYSRIATTTDFHAWSFYQGLTTDYRLNYISCAAKSCNIVGNRGMNLLSRNGEASWKILKAGSTEFSLSGIAASSSSLVTVGNGGAILLSEDYGANWRAPSLGWQNYNLTAVNYLHGKFYAVGSTGMLMVSPDGNEWSKVPLGQSEQLNDIAYNAEPSADMKKSYPWIIVGNKGTILGSFDGINWVRQDSQLSNDLKHVIYDTSDKNFYIAGNNGLIITTQNLVKKFSYTAKTTPNNYNLWSITNGVMASSTTDVAVNNVSLAVGDRGNVLIGLNGSSKYSLVNCDVKGTLYAVISFNGSFYAVGQLGTLVKISFAANKTPVCTVLDSTTDISLFGIVVKSGY